MSCNCGITTDGGVKDSLFALNARAFIDPDCPTRSGSRCSPVGGDDLHPKGHKVADLGLGGDPHRPGQQALRSHPLPRQPHWHLAPLFLADGLYALL